MNIDALVRNRRAKLEPTAKDVKAGIGIRDCVVVGIYNGHGICFDVIVTETQERLTVAGYRVDFQESNTVRGKGGTK